MTVPLMVDLSSNNIPPGKTAAIFDLAAHRNAGYEWLCLKSTESTTYGWADGLGLADRWHKLGGKVVWYHFARPGDGTAQADFFLAHIGNRFGRDDVPCIDCETGGVGHDVVKAFIERVHAKQPTRHGLIYGGADFLKSGNIRSARGWGLWIAGYPTYPFVPPGWKTVTAHQFTDRATGVSGIPGGVDQSHLFGWMLATHPTPTPKPKPKPVPKPKPPQRHPWKWLRHNGWVKWLRGHGLHHRHRKAGK